MQQKLTIDKVATKLAATNLPVLFIDTCAQLDIFRIVDRACDFAPYKPFVELSEKVKRKEVIVVYNETVENEYNYNVRKVVLETRSHINNQNRKWNAFRSMMRKAQVANDVTLSADKVIQSADALLRTILKDACIVKDYDGALHSSYQVVLRHIAPAERDSQFKDAYIFKTCLDLAKMSGKQIVFCSTNTKDYCVDNNGNKTINPSILSQAAANNVIVTTSLGEAIGKI